MGAKTLIAYEVTGATGQVEGHAHELGQRCLVRVGARQDERADAIMRSLERRMGLVAYHRYDPVRRDGWTYYRALFCFRTEQWGANSVERASVTFRVRW